MCSCLAGLCCRFVFLNSNSDRISCDLFLVNNFFHFLENQFRSMRSYCLVRSCSLEQRIVLYHRCFRIASSFFKFLKTSNSVSQTHLAKRRKRDLNPRAGINRPTPLAGAPLQPLEYFSKAWFQGFLGQVTLQVGSPSWESMLNYTIRHIKSQSQDVVLFSTSWYKWIAKRSSTRKF